MMKILNDADADVSVLKGRKVAVIGYGSQGCAQSFMLKESGIDLIVGVREGGDSWKKALVDGHKVMTISEAVRNADIVHILVPDELQADIFSQQIAKHLRPGKTLCFSHGFSVVHGLIRIPRGVDVIMVAPMGPGSEAKAAYVADTGIPAVVAVHANETGGARETALAMAKAMKFTRAGVLEASFEQETFTDLFGEQVVLCGGLAELVRNGFDTLVESGYPGELAYFECLHQVELLARLMRQGGLGGMWNEISNTAEYGGRTVGPKIVPPTVKEEMKSALKKIETGKFAKEFLKEVKEGMPNVKKWREEDKNLDIEKTGERLRKRFKNPSEPSSPVG